MNKQFQFMIIFLLISAIPAIIYIVVAPQNQNNTSATFPTAPVIPATSAPIVQESSENRLVLTPEAPPFKTGPQAFTLRLAHRGQAVSRPPVVAVTMPMGASTMTAPVRLETLPRAGEFRVRTDFSMTGAWQVIVTPAGTTGPLRVPVQVQ